LRDQISHPYKIKDKIIALFTLICTRFDKRREEEMLFESVISSDISILLVSKNTNYL